MADNRTALELAVELERAIAISDLNSNDCRDLMRALVAAVKSEHLEDLRRRGVHDGKG